MLPSKWFTLAIGLPQIVDFLPPVSSPRQARDDDCVAGTETTRGWSWAVVGCLANVIGKTWENIGQNIGEHIWISINGGSQNGWLMEKLGGYPHFRDPPIMRERFCIQSDASAAISWHIAQKRHCSENLEQLSPTVYRAHRQHLSV